MQIPVFVYDPTPLDDLSRVRGIGRYLQILRENAEPHWVFTHDIKSIPKHGVFINPFINFFQYPQHIKRVTDHQIAVIHDLIGLKYPDDFPVGIKGELATWVNKQVLKSYDVIITDSETSKKDLVAMLGFAPQKVQVLYPTLPSLFWENKQKNSGQGQGEYCIYVGDGTWNKNLTNMARAIQKTNIVAMFVGKIFETDKKTEHPWHKELNEFKTLTKNDKQFIFPGFVTDFELLKLYEQAKVNILLSRDEGFGFSYVEAASCGCPSLLADRPIFHEISGENAVFADPENADEIAARLSIFFKSDFDRNALSAKVKKRSQFFKSESFKSNLLRLIYPV